MLSFRPTTLLPLLLCLCWGCGEQDPSGPSARRAGKAKVFGPAPGSRLPAWEGPAPTPADAGLVWVTMPPGFFRMGAADRPSQTEDPAEPPPHLVTLSGFELTRTEITVGQYLKCVYAGACEAAVPARQHGRTRGRDGRYERWFQPYGPIGGCTLMAGDEDLPMNCVTWQAAHAFCKWVGGRMPTEAQWEYAARSAGTRAPDWPWGAEVPTCARATVPSSAGPGCGAAGAARVCARSPAGDTAQGLCDMSGNVAEWVDDWYDPEYYASSATLDPTGPEAFFGDERCGVRGGGFRSTPDALRVHWRAGRALEAYAADLGFRCMRRPR